MSTVIEEIQAIPKIDLHVHLNGAASSEILKEILIDENPKLPASFNVDTDLKILSPKSSLIEYLKPWLALNKVPCKRENLEKITKSAFREMNKNNVKHCEIRNSVLYLSKLMSVSDTTALEYILEALEAASVETDISFGLVLTVKRGIESVSEINRLMYAYRCAGRPQKVVGIDLSGDENVDIPKELPCLFKDAKDRYGLGITIHAGETGNVMNIRKAINCFHADRIGHGTAIMRDAQIVDLILSRGICVEICPLSNRLTASVDKDGPYPTQEFKKLGIPFVICSDNPGIHGCGLNEDFSLSYLEGLSINDLCSQIEIANKFQF